MFRISAVTANVFQLCIYFTPDGLTPPIISPTSVHTTHTRVLTIFIFRFSLPRFSKYFQFLIFDRTFFIFIAPLAQHVHLSILIVTKIRMKTHNTHANIHNIHLATTRQRPLLPSIFFRKNLPLQKIQNKNAKRNTMRPFNLVS